MTEKIFALIFSLVAMILMVCSFQCKRKNIVLIMQSSGQLAFTISFLFLKAWFGIILNGISILRNLVYLLFKNNKKAQLIVLYITLALQIASYFLFIFVLDPNANKIMNFFPIISVLLMTTSLFFTGRKFRFVKMIESSGWLVYDCYLGLGELGGIISDSFCIISGIIAFIRYKSDQK